MEIKRFYQSLIAQSQFGFGSITAAEIFTRCIREGPAFNKKYKEFWQYTIRNYYGGLRQWKSEDFDAIPYSDKYRNIYHFTYLIFWEEDSDDIELMFESPPEIDSQLLEEFEEKVYEVLEEVKAPVVRDFSERIIMSKCFDKKKLKTDW